MATYEYKVVHGKTQGDLEHTINELAKTGYRVVGFHVNEIRGVARGAGPFQAVMERHIG
jgi:hypothetical protein